MMKSAKLSILLMLYFFTIFTLANASLKLGYYHSSCPNAESIVRKAVNKAVSRNPGLGAGIIRMHFHDCFVRGCDASILLDSTPGNPSEKEHPANNPSLRGYEVIDEAKIELESVCPQTVSCADIIAFAARDSAFKLGGIRYSVPSGRRDGRISIKDEPTANLPPFNLNARELEENFAKKGLSLDEMVTLSGAHSIGRSHCSSFLDRLYSFNSTHPQDPTMDVRLVKQLMNRCPRPNSNSGSIDPIVPIDVVTPNRLDNMYYVNLKNNRGLLTSDQTLWNSPSTARMVRSNAIHGANWDRKFAAAMVKMGTIEVMTGMQGEIRKNCRIVN